MRLAAYRSFWKISPPVDALAAAFMGYKPQTRASHDEALDQMAAMMGGRIQSG